MISGRYFLKKVLFIFSILFKVYCNKLLCTDLPTDREPHEVNHNCESDGVNRTCEPDEVNCACEPDEVKRACEPGEVNALS